MTYFSELFPEQYDTILWRSAYIGGRDFINRYLEKVTDAESDTEFSRRKTLTFAPTDAADAIDEVKNSIFQRIVDVTRIGGGELYQAIMRGDLGGVDYEYRDMNTFMGEQVLLDLLLMQHVGVFVDNFTYDELGTNELTAEERHPFLTLIPRERINGIERSKKGGLTRVEFDNFIFTKEEGIVFFQVKDKDGVLSEVTPLELKQIPFVLFETKRSLMQNVADIQVALLNLHSSDLRMAIEGNYHIYYEYGSARGEGKEATHLKKNKTVQVGVAKGRKVFGGAPGFVSPDPDNLRASMEKIAALEAKIRRQVHLNVATQNPRRQAADSKAYDDRPLEAGLSAIGQILERGEKQIAAIIADYLNSEPAVISYPQRYDLKTDEERRVEAKELDELGMLVPSDTYRRQTKKMIAERVFGTRLSTSEMEKIYDEIEKAETVCVSSDILLKAHEQGLVDNVTASTALGFDGETVIPIATEEHAQKLAEMQKAQTTGFNANRGTDSMPGIDENQRGEEK